METIDFLTTLILFSIHRLDFKNLASYRSL
ncbi:DNA-3-methyladenine glycosylase I [Leptospira kirschneri serovar Mozdok]|nr:DNA-3-methyladenine glycosylase I [Leptospira kirschneri serovar Mozdok]